MKYRGPQKISLENSIINNLVAQVISYPPNIPSKKYIVFILQELTVNVLYRVQF